MRILYIVTTPIGNMGDITYRAVEILKKVDLIACEDTRHTGKLLAYFGIKKSMIRCDERVQEANIIKIINSLKTGIDVAFVSDAGTPGISDPGARLINKAVENNINIIPIPGPSALATILSISGIKNNVLFLGFLPKKKGRKTLFENIIKFLDIFPKTAIVIYESPYRIKKTLKEFEQLSNFDIIIGRELTKKFEEIIRGDLRVVFDYLSKNPRKIKGEFTICLTKLESK